MAPQRWLAISLMTMTGLAAGSSLACERGQTEASHAPEPCDSDCQAAAAVRSEAAALADAIDPGPVAPMSADLPAWLAEQVAGDLMQGEAEREAMVRATVDAFAGDQRFALIGQPGALLALARVVALLEGRDAAGRARTQDLVDLHTLYTVLDQPAFASPQGMFAQFIPAIVAAAESAGGEDLDEVAAFADTLFDRMRRAAPLRRALVARVLREDLDHPAVPELLRSLADNLGREDPRLALAAVRLGQALDPDPGPTQELDLAYRCCLVLDLTCADEALSRASADPDALDEAGRGYLANVRETRATAAVAVAHAGATDLDGRLARARALFDLGLYDQARPELEALRTDHPRDARPVALMARLELAAHLDVVAAAAIIDAAGGPLEREDVEYYEVAIAARVLSLFNGVLPEVMAGGADLEASLAPRLVELRADVDGYVATGSSLAVVFEALLDLSERGIPLLARGDHAGQAALVREALDRAVGLERQLPGEPHAFVLLMSAAELMGDKRAAVAAASTPVTGSGSGSGAGAVDLAALRLRKAQALVNLAITWADPALLEPAAAELAQIPAGEHERAKRVTTGNLHAVAGALTNQTDHYDQAIDAYLSAYTEFQDPTAANNLGVVLARLGNEQAADAFAAAVAAGGDQAVVARINQIAYGVPAFDASAELEAIADDERRSASVRRLAMDELARRSLGKTHEAWVARREASLDEPSVLPRTVDLPNDAGAVLLGQLDFDVSYSVDGLILKADAASTPWLVLAPDSDD